MGLSFEEQLGAFRKVILMMPPSTLDTLSHPIYVYSRVHTYLMPPSSLGPTTKSADEDAVGSAWRQVLLCRQAPIQ